MFIKLITILFLIVQYAKGICDWPTNIANTVWHDSSKGEITFTTNTLTAWSIKVTAAIGEPEYDTWTCHSTALYQSDNIVVAMQPPAVTFANIYPLQFDYEQEVFYQHNAQKVGLLYFKHQGSMDDLGSAVNLQVNKNPHIKGQDYSFVLGQVLDEECGTAVGRVSSIASMVHYNFYRHDYWENVALHMDNCAGQNKINTVKGSSDTIELHNKQYYAFLCFQLTEITQSSYRYYLMSGISENLDNERVGVAEDGDSEDWNLLCLQGDIYASYRPSDSEYRVMIKSDNLAAGKIDCPYTFLGSYDYTHISDGTTSCDSTDDVLSTCTNSQEISFDYNACNTKVAFSESNQVWCVDTVPFGGNNYVTLYNGNDADADIDNVNIFRFSCIVISGDGSKASIVPNSCRKDQTPETVPVQNGQNNGAILTLTKFTVTCPLLTAPDSGTVSYSTNGAVTSASFNCSSEFPLVGPATRVCQADDNWSDDNPTCTCPIPSSIADGDVILTNGGLTVSFTCNIGFVLVGASTLTCDTMTNIWSDSYPSCDECPTLGTPIDGSVTLASNGLTTVATYSCNVGTTLNGDSSRTCKTDITWTNIAPTCTSCPTLSDIPSGNVTINTDNTTTTATYYCVAGYSISGDSTTECTISGTWDSDPPSCECNDPLTPDNGTLTVSHDKIQAFYTCNLGFSIQGVSSRSCQGDGTGWSSDDPICVGCPTLSEPTNGSVSLSTDGTKTVATFSCNIGFTLKGGVTSECQTDGSWSSTAPTCTQCDVVPTVSSGSYTLISDGSTTSAQYSCSVGTTISGDVTIACDVNGVWSVSSETTSCVECPALSTSGRTYEISTDGTTSTAELVCENGYSLANGGSIECQSNGTWSSNSDVSQCVSTSSSTESKNTSDSLLPAVIAIAVIDTALGIALGLALLYIWKLKKNPPGNTGDKKTNENGLNSNMFSSVPPMEHSQHIMDIRSTSSAMSAPMGYVSSPRVDSVTPRSLSSSTSNTSLHLSHLNLIREETSSEILDQKTPAPWSKMAKQKDEHGSSSNSKSSMFPPISENGTLVTPRGNLSTEHHHARKKKLSFGKKIQRQNSTEPNKAYTDIKNDTEPKDDQAKPKKANSLYTAKVGSLSSTIKTEGGVRNGGSVVPKLKLSEQPQRATTPVKHYMEINDPHSCNTPRSNTFTTVQ